MARVSPSNLADPTWWRRSVVYQIYPRSFRDSDGDGTGDLTGMTRSLSYLAALGVDAVWVSPWYPSPLADGGYDVSNYCDIDPRYGSLADAALFVDEAHSLGMRVLIDLVPNHASSDHPLFQAALAAPPGSSERDLFIFRDGRGPGGDEPPTNWGSIFGGSAWERVIDAQGRPEQWYCHMFAPEQPDWNWENPAVAAMFDEVIQFWLDRGIDGLRIDVADSMVKDASFPDTPLNEKTGFGTAGKYEGHPFWDQPGVERIHLRWRAIADSYASTPLGPRVFVSEAHMNPAERLVKYVAPGRLHTTFNFDHLWCEWTASSQRAMIQTILRVHAEVDAPPTWVIGNHDTTRVVTRYGKPETGWRFLPEGVHPDDARKFAEHFAPLPTDVGLGRRRARAAALLELALPGVPYIYQGEELGLPEVEDLPVEALQDPTWERSGHTIRGRDGCRVPLPWSGDEPPYGFGPGTGQPWLPQPATWADLTVEAQTGDPGSHLELYRAALTERHHNPALGDGSLTWDDTPADVLSFTREPGFRCIVNFGEEPVPLPDNSWPILASGDVSVGIPRDTAVWLSL
jgi:alpha-glucosidase